MVILDVFAKNISITYKTTLISKAALLTFIFGTVTIVLPFIFAYKSKGFWVKRDVFYEQPEVKFKGEYIFTATTNNLSDPLITCSSLPRYQQKLEFLDKCSMIKVREIDKNFDGKVDEFELNLQINLPYETQLTSLHIIVPLDYKLHVCPLQMQAAIIFQELLPVPLSTYMVISEIKMKQSTPLNCYNRQINNSYNYSIIMDESDFNSFEIMRIILDYAKRNISTVLRNTYTTFVPSKTQRLDFSLNIRFPEDKIYYRPGFWQTMKWAWIQYLSIYLIVSWFVTKIKSYIFSRRLVLFYEDNPVKKKQ